MQIENYLNSNWKHLLKEEFDKEYFCNLKKKIKEDEKNWYTIYPFKKDIFKAFDLVSFEKTKVVIVGQDPYHQPDQANWLAFSVSEWIKIPPSLRNIFSELQIDLGRKNLDSWNLERWAVQWVLLLNTVMTVRKSQPWSHKNIWWEIFTDKVLNIISQKKQNCVFVLRGNYAKTKKELLDSSKHLLIESSHPSPFSFYRWFRWSRPFSRINNFLKSKGKSEINWI